MKPALLTVGVVELAVTAGVVIAAILLDRRRRRDLFYCTDHTTLRRLATASERDPLEEWLNRLQPGDVFITPRGTEIPVGRLSARELVEFFADIESLPETKEVVL